MHGDKQNDTYVERIAAAAEAAVDLLDRKGVVDTRSEPEAVHLAAASLVALGAAAIAVAAADRSDRSRQPAVSRSTGRR